MRSVSDRKVSVLMSCLEFLCLVGFAYTGNATETVSASLMFVSSVDWTDSRGFEGKKFKLSVRHLYFYWKCDSKTPPSANSGLAGQASHPQQRRAI